MTEQTAGSYIEPLTNREMDVLRLLAEGLSNQEIAESLVMEVSTVKWYNTQIYGKLQVKNRKQAVTRALTLDLLEVQPDNSLHRPQHNLPADTLPFIGRTSEIDALTRQLTSENIRLITILGLGGMGKSRLSIEVGRRLLGYFKDGVYFVPLAAVTSAEQIITTVADIIGFQFHSDLQPAQQLADYLQDKLLLLIIDNFEHLLDNAGLMSDFLKAAPDLKLLVTSREKLELAGEALYVISGLSIPYKSHADIAAHDAVKLFLEAASRSASPPGEDDMEAVARICQALGGMPLAILLAAAWLDTLSLSEIESELKAGLDILESAVRDAPQRHQSIEAVFDYSWQRLDAQQQNIFMRLSVFREGFTREAAKEVAGASIRDLQHLVHSSFIQHLPSGRYAIHELMRQYGEHKLAASGELEGVRENHARYFAAFIAPLGDIPWQQVDSALLEQVNMDSENVRAAWHFNVEKKDFSEMRRLLDGLWHLLDLFSRSQEAIDLLEAALAAFSGDEVDDAVFCRGQVLSLLGWFYGDIGQKTKALEFTQQGQAMLQPFGPSKALLQAIVGQVIMLFFLNRFDESLPILIQGHKYSRVLGEQTWEPIFRSLIGNVYCVLGQYEQGLEWLSEPSGAILIAIGEYSRAEAALLKDLQVAEHHRYSRIRTYGYLVENAVLQGQNEKAWQYLQRGLYYADDLYYAWASLELLGFALNYFIAEAHFVMAAEILSLIMCHAATPENTRAKVVHFEETLRTHLPAKDFEAAWVRGQQLDLGDLITDLMER